MLTTHTIPTVSEIATIISTPSSPLHQTTAFEYWLFFNLLEVSVEQRDADSWIAQLHTKIGRHVITHRIPQVGLKPGPIEGIGFSKQNAIDNLIQYLLNKDIYLQTKKQILVAPLQKNAYYNIS